MATYTSRQIVSRRKEWIVPTINEYGAPLGEFLAALAAASASYRQDHGIPETVALADDTLRVRPDDDDIVISYVLEVAE